MQLSSTVNEITIDHEDLTIEIFLGDHGLRLRLTEAEGYTATEYEFVARQREDEKYWILAEVATWPESK